MSKTIVKKKKMSPTKRNLLLDIGLSVGFLLVFMQEITGDTLHEWLAMGLFVGLMTHLVWHWKWIVNITKRIFNPKLKRKTRMSYAVVMGLGVSFIMMAVSGLLMSESVLPTLGFNPGSSRFEDLHELASSVTLGLVGVHLFQHWKWLWTNGRKYLLKPIPKLSRQS